MTISHDLNFCSCDRPDPSSVWYCRRCEQIKAADDGGTLKVRRPPGEDFRVFYRRFRDCVRGVVPKSYRYRDAVIDDTLIKAFDRLETFSGKGNFNNWLRRIARKTYISDVRERSKDRYEILFDFDTLAAIQDSLRKKEDLETDRDTILWLQEYLPEECFQILWLRHVEGNTKPQVAKKLALKESTQRSREARAMKIARALLDLKSWLDNSPSTEDRRMRSLVVGMPGPEFSVLYLRYTKKISPNQIRSFFSLSKSEYDRIHRQALDLAKAIDGEDKAKNES